MGVVSGCVAVVGTAGTEFDAVVALWQAAWNVSILEGERREDAMSTRWPSQILPPQAPCGSRVGIADLTETTTMVRVLGRQGASKGAAVRRMLQYELSAGGVCRAQLRGRTAGNSLA
eukprot:6185803-Pleurochrysis_carterae.AAC.2